MKKNIKITLFAGTGSGKSTLKLGLLNQYSPVNGNSFVIDGKNVEKVREELEHEICSANNVAATTDFDLRLSNCTFKYKGKKIIDFDLIDLKGEDITKINKEELIVKTSPNKSSFKDIINSSDAIIIFVDSVLLKNYLYLNNLISLTGEHFVEVQKNPDNKTDLIRLANRFYTESNNISTAISSCLEESSKKKIIFALSKVDSEFIVSEDINPLKVNIQNIYKCIFEMVGSNNVSIYETYALGAGKIRSEFKIKNLEGEKYFSEKYLSSSISDFKFHNVKEIFVDILKEFVSNIKREIANYEHDLFELKKEYTKAKDESISINNKQSILSSRINDNLSSRDGLKAEIGMMKNRLDEAKYEKEKCFNTLNRGIIFTLLWHNKIGAAKDSFKELDKEIPLLSNQISNSEASLRNLEKLIDKDKEDLHDNGLVISNIINEIRTRESYIYDLENKISDLKCVISPIEQYVLN